MRNGLPGGEAHEAPPFPAGENVIVCTGEGKTDGTREVGDVTKISARRLHGEDLAAGGHEACREREKHIDPQGSSYHRNGAHPDLLGPLLDDAHRGKRDCAHHLAEKACPSASSFDQDHRHLRPQAGEDDPGKPSPAADVGEDPVGWEVRGNGERVDQVLAHESPNFSLAGEPGRAVPHR